MAEDSFGLVGTTQGAFTVEKVVAEGGFGVVYRAYHGAFRAPVALKCLKLPGEIPESLRDQFLEQFRDEGALLFRLSAALPAVVRPLHHDVLTTASGQFVPFIALEWLEGRTLASFLEARAVRHLQPLSPEESVRLLAPVARALQAAHQFPDPKGTICVVHRDLKPANIFLAYVHGAEVVKILDYGIARARDAAGVIAGATAHTSGGMPVAFTPRYGAPEQWAPKRFGATGPWTDVWGLALTLLEVMVGRPILDGDAMALMGTALDEKRRPTPRAEGLDVPDALEDAFLRALAVDPRERTRDVGAFWDEVEQALALERSAPPIALPSRAPGRLLSGRSGPSGAGPSAPPSASAETMPAIPRAAALPQVPHARSSAPAAAAPLEAPLAAPPTRAKTSSASELELPERGNDMPISVDWARSGHHRAGPTTSYRPAAALERPRWRSDPPGPGDLKTLFALPLRLAAAGVLVSVVDQAAATLVLGGQHIAVGPFKLLWLAAALVLAAIAIAVVRLFGSSR